MMGVGGATSRTENPRDNMALPKSKLTFEQMLEQEMKKQGSEG
jgi:hypothetical protein